MSTSRGRCDIRATNQSVGIPKRRAHIRESFGIVIHYNRLELAPPNRVPPPAIQLLHRPGYTVAPPAGRRGPAILAVRATPWNNLFLVHRGESCNKQVSGVSSFRKGIVL
jgi:hypothetical protein